MIDVGSWVRVKGNSNFHHFPIGCIVKIIRCTGNLSDVDAVYLSEGIDDYNEVGQWYLLNQDLEEL